MHVSFLCFASYYIPDFGCCRPKFIFHAVSSAQLSSSPNTCSVELRGGGGGGVVSMNNFIIAKWRLALSISKCLGIAEE